MIQHKTTSGLLAISLFAALTSGTALAAEAPASPHSLSANVSLVTDYYFRGLSQTWHQPALQGGADYSHASGWYAGIWGSSISGNQYAGGSLELDYYAGYNGKFNDDFGWTVGLYGYYYPGANVSHTSGGGVDQKYDTLEWNAGVSYKWVSVKYSSTTGDFFGANTKTGFDSGSKNSSYLELNASIPLTDSISAGLHLGRTDVKAKLATPLASGANNPDYSDYRIGVTKTFNDGWNVGLAYAKSSNSAYYNDTASVAGSSGTKNLGEGRFILSAGRSF